MKDSNLKLGKKELKILPAFGEKKRPESVCDTVGP